MNTSRKLSPLPNHATPLREFREAAMAMGFQVHRGPAGSGYLEDRFWWTLKLATEPAMRHSQGEYDSESAAWQAISDLVSQLGKPGYLGRVGATTAEKRDKRAA